MSSATCLRRPLQGHLSSLVTLTFTRSSGLYVLYDSLSPTLIVSRSRSLLSRRGYVWYRSCPRAVRDENGRTLNPDLRGMGRVGVQ